MASIHTDQRPTLTIATETWDRQDSDGQRSFVREAAALGYRLSIVRPDGEEWAPDPMLADW